VRNKEKVRKIGSDLAVFLFISFWESMHAVKNYAGNDIDGAHYVRKT
jgi:hypothetical protein